MIAATLTPWPVASGFGLGLGLMLVWYWIRLGEPDIQRSRRRIRRVSIAVMMFSLPALVRGLGFVDPRTAGTDFIVTWSVVIVGIGIVVMTVLFDVLNSMRLHRAHQRSLERTAIDALRREVRGDGDGPSS